jgi:hypothetical protein
MAWLNSHGLWHELSDNAVVVADSVLLYGLQQCQCAESLGFEEKSISYFIFLTLPPRAKRCRRPHYLRYIFAKTRAHSFPPPPPPPPGFSSLYFRSQAQPRASRSRKNLEALDKWINKCRVRRRESPCTEESGLGKRQPFLFNQLNALRGGRRRGGGGHRARG